MVLVAAVAGATRIRIGDEFVGIFRRRRVRADYEAVNAAIGGVNALTIVIEGPAPETFAEPAMLRVLDRLQEWLAA